MTDTKLPALPPLPKPDIVDPGRFGFAWRQPSVEAYACAYARAALAAQSAPTEPATLNHDSVRRAVESRVYPAPAAEAMQPVAPDDARDAAMSAGSADKAAS